MITDWNTEGPKTNPTDGTVLADTGQSEARQYRLTAVISASVAARVDLVVRDATDTISSRSMPIFISAGQTFVLPQTMEFNLADRERVKLLVNGAVVGTIGGSLFAA